MALAWMHLKPHDLEDPPNRSGVEAQAAGKIAQGEEAPSTRCGGTSRRKRAQDEEASGKNGRLSGGEAPACHNLEPQNKTNHQGS